MIPPVRDVEGSVPPGGPSGDPDCAPGNFKLVGIRPATPTDSDGLRKDKRTVGGCPAEHPSDTPRAILTWATRQPEGSPHPTEECEVQAASLGDKWAVFLALVCLRSRSSGERTAPIAPSQRLQLHAWMPQRSELRVAVHDWPRSVCLH